MKMKITKKTMSDYNYNKQYQEHLKTPSLDKEYMDTPQSFLQVVTVHDNLLLIKKYLERAAKGQDTKTSIELSLDLVDECMVILAENDDEEED